MRHRRRISVLVALLAIALTTRAFAQSDEKRKKQREKSLSEMRNSAETTKVYQLDDEKQTAAKLLPHPLFRYSDQPRGIFDATLWGWGTRGRPVAVSKLEAIRDQQRRSLWQYCLVSLSEGRIEAIWSGGERFLSKKPGLEFRRIPEGPAPSDKKIGRLFQLKKLARRFSATIYVDGRRDKKQEMRLLPRPIYRYSDANAGLRDGAIFGFATNGTNPDTLLVIELLKQGSSAPEWQYGLARMTTGELHVRLDNNEVWQALHNAPIERWAIVHEPRGK